MDSTSDKVIGIVNETVDRIGNAANRTYDNVVLEVEGQAEQLRADGQKALDVIKASLKESVEKAGELVTKVGDEIEKAGEKLGHLAD